MKWLRTLVFLIAVRSSYPRIVQPVTYSYTTTNDAAHRPHNPHTTPYSRHPSILTHHYYDPPAENKKVEHVVAAPTLASPSAWNETRKTPRKKNDYVAKVSYVRDSGSVSFATTIEDKRKEPQSTESPMRKLRIVRKRRPLRPADMIPVREDEGEDHVIGSANRIARENITAKAVNVVAVTPQPEVTESQTNSELPSKVYPHKIRKIRLKPTITTTTTTTTTTSTSAKPIWQDVDKTTPRQVKQNKRLKSSTESTTGLMPSPFMLYRGKQTTTTAAPAENISGNDAWELVGVQLTAAENTQPLLTTTTSASAKSRYGKYNPNYESTFQYRDTEITHQTENDSKPEHESEDDSSPSKEDVETDEESVDLEYPDEYNDLSDEEESPQSNDNEETDRNAEHTYEAPVKLLLKPLRYSYSNDQKQSATGGERKEEVNGVKVQGEEHRKNNHQRGSSQGDIGYVARKTHDHAKEGSQDQKSHQKHFEEEDGHKKKNQEEHGHLKEREIEVAGKKKANYEESGKHQKGHSTKGSHNVHKKDEYMKNHEFYDEHHEGDSHQKYNDFEKKHKLKHSGALKHAHDNKDYSEGHEAKKNRHHGGHHLHKGHHHVNDNGSLKHFGSMKVYHDGEGSTDHKKWKNEKAEDSESENES